VTPAGRAKLLDVGLAGSVLESESTRLGRVVGTMDYMAPEQITGGVVGPYTDVYAAAVTFWLSARPLRRRIGPTLFLVVTLFGIFTIVLGATRSFAVALLAMLMLSAVDSVSVFIRGTLVPLVTPRPARGRVMAVEGVFLGASNELGAFQSGVAGHLLGTGPAVVFGGIATLGVAAVWSIFFPALSRLDRFPEQPPE
jgi:hypothetical protein